MTSFHPRGRQAARDWKFKSKRSRSNSDSFQEEDLTQGFQWVSEQLMLIKNVMCACLGRLALFQGNYWADLPKYTLANFSGEKKKINIKKKQRFLSLLPFTSPCSPQQRKSLPFGAASSYLNLEKLGEGSYATVYKGISRWVTPPGRDFRDEDPSPLMWHCKARWHMAKVWDLCKTS